MTEMLHSHQNKSQYENCSEHGEETLTLYCKTCSELICDSCSYKNTHYGHKISAVSQLHPKYSRQVEDNLEIVRKKITDFDSAIKGLADFEQQLTSHGEDVQREIQNHAQRLIDEIKKSESDLLQQVSTAIGYKRSSVIEQREQAERIQNQLKSCEEMVEESLRDWSEQEIVLEQQRMINEMKILCHQVEPKAFQAIERTDVEFTKHENNVEEIGKITFTGYKKAICKKLQGPRLTNKPSTITLTLQSLDGSHFILPFLSLLTCKLSTNRSPAIDCDINCHIKETVDACTGEAITISFTPQSSEIHQLQVQVGGINAIGSPCAFPVMPTPDIPHTTITGLNKPWGVAVSDQGDIVVAESGAHRITIKKKESNDLSFGKKGVSMGKLNNPAGVAITADRNILVTDDHRIQRFTFNGVCVKLVGSGKSGSGQMEFNCPIGIAIDPNNEQIFVADSKNNRVQVFANDLSFLRTIVPQAPEKFKNPYDVGVDCDGYLYVAELNNHGISKLTTSGEFLCRFGSYGHSPGQLFHPTALAVNNLIYVVDYNSRVSIFDTEGNHVHCFGKKGSRDEKFNRPCGIATDTMGNVCVSDILGNKVVMF